MALNIAHPRLQSAARGLSLWAVLFIPGCSAAVFPSHAATATVSAERLQTIRGWGVALAWDANVVFGSEEARPQIPDPVEQARYMDLLFGSPQHGLGLNVVRYNIGGGDNPDRQHCIGLNRPEQQPGARMDGFLDGLGRNYEWSRDASQRRMLREAADRGANIFEAFSNSAPWWMTLSGCSSGARHPGEDNLRTDMVAAFASYLAIVAEHFRTEGVRFESLSPINEPDGTWWVRGGRQEGSFTTLPMQEAILNATADALRGTGIIVSGTEPNDFDDMSTYLSQMGAAPLAALGRVNVHLYNGSNERRLHDEIKVRRKELWMSEFGCCFSTNPADPTGALTMALSIERSLKLLSAEVWCFWQATWGVVDIRDGRPRPLPQFRAIAQYTRFIRPGDTILATNGPVLAARSPSGRVTVVAVNARQEETPVSIDLSAVARAGDAITLQRTLPAKGAAIVVVHKWLDEYADLIDRQPPESITTYVMQRDAELPP